MPRQRYMGTLPPASSACLVLAVLACLLLGCSNNQAADFDLRASDAVDTAQDGPGMCTATVPTIHAPAMVVPSTGIPAQVALQQANNNLDVVQHSNGRIYLAFRTAPSHFASPEVELYVVSSQDQAVWDYEAVFSQDTDLREPRFLSWDGRLFLYFAVLGKTLSDFEPEGALFSERLANGEWTDPEPFYLDGFIPWRTRSLDGIPYMIGYVGGEAIYDPDAGGLEVHWLTTADGLNWEAVVPGQPVVLTGGSSETDFAFLEDGSLVAIARNEEGDDTGYGSKICTAPPDDLGNWTCASDPKKYDSPLVFTHNNVPYLIGRRNVTETGAYDLQRQDLPAEDRYLEYQLAYWSTPKRTALWRIDPETLTVTFVADFDSAGDTCFPSILQESPNQYMVYNYSSPTHLSDISWLEGQTGPTNIYRYRLDFDCEE